MTTLNLPGGTVTFNDSPHQLKEVLRTEHTYYSMIEAGIGSDFESVDSHFTNVIAFLEDEDIEAAVLEINNLRYLFYNAINKQYSARSLALATLVQEVYGKPWPDYSEKGLEQLVIVLGEMGLTDEVLSQTWGDVKKKSMTN